MNQTEQWTWTFKVPNVKQLLSHFLDVTWILGLTNERDSLVENAAPMEIDTVKS